MSQEQEERYVVERIVKRSNERVSARADEFRARLLDEFRENLRRWLDRREERKRQEVY